MWLLAMMKFLQWITNFGYYVLLCNVKLGKDSDFDFF
jgi:hypothetical protein